MRNVREERGAVAVITAVVLLALLSISAIVLDVGDLYHNRRFLQNGADAGALAIAQTCAIGNGNCGTYNATALSFAQNNSPSYAQSLAASVCGSTSGTNLPQCTTGTPSNVPTGATGWVEVTTSAVVNYSFARVMGFTSNTVTATAIAAWGGPGSATGLLPLTISACEFIRYADRDGNLGANPDETFPPPSSGPWDSDGDADLAPAPPYTGNPYPPAPYTESTIYFHNTTNANNCPIANNSGANLPGGFGWLQTSSGCQTATAVNYWYNDNTGRPPPNSCTPTLMNQAWKQVIAIPIFSDVNGLTGSNGKYKILFYAFFYLTGYSIEGQYKQSSVVTGKDPCSGNDSCISGFFVKDLQPVNGNVGGPSTGGTAVQLIG